MRQTTTILYGDTFPGHGGFQSTSRALFGQGSPAPAGTRTRTSSGGFDRLE
jgi:hypothetical protein